MAKSSLQGALATSISLENALCVTELRRIEQSIEFSDSSRFAGRWVILAAATPLSRFAGWVILNPPGLGICGPSPDPNPALAQFAAWTSPADARPQWFVADSL
jgi:hypothetical protein